MRVVITTKDHGKFVSKFIEEDKREDLHNYLKALADGQLTSTSFETDECTVYVSKEILQSSIITLNP